MWLLCFVLFSTYFTSRRMNLTGNQCYCHPLKSCKDYCHFILLFVLPNSLETTAIRLKFPLLHWKQVNVSVTSKLYFNKTNNYSFVLKFLDLTATFCPVFFTKTVRKKRLIITLFIFSFFNSNKVLAGYTAIFLKTTIFKFCSR